MPIFCIVGQREREDKGNGRDTKNGDNVETCDYVRGGVCGPFKKAKSKLLCMTRGVKRRVSEKGFYVVGRGREEALSSISLEEVDEEKEEKERTKETTGNREKTMSPPLGTL